jgi:hypothetical protein
MAYVSNGNRASESSVADLLKQFSRQASRLAREEAELAKVQMAAKGKRAGVFGGVRARRARTPSGSRRLASSRPACCSAA